MATKHAHINETIHCFFISIFIYSFYEIFLLIFMKVKHFFLYKKMNLLYNNVKK